MRSKASAGNSGGQTFIEAARREQFVQCAIDALAEAGYPGTSIAAVAARAGVAKSVVLYHFHTKAELLEAVVAHVLWDKAAPIMSGILTAAPDDRSRLRDYVRGCVLFAWEHRNEVKALSEVFANLRTEDGVRRYGPSENQPMIHAVEEMLRAGQASGQFREFDTRSMAFTIRAAIDLLPATFETDPTLDGERYAEELASIFDHATRRVQS